MMAELKIRKEKIIFCLEAGIAGACIATACFYVAGASFAVLFAGKMTAKMLMTAWKLWLEFFALAFLALAGYTYAIVSFRGKPKGADDKLQQKREVFNLQKEDSEQIAEERLDDFVKDLLDHEIEAILQDDENLQDWQGENLKAEGNEV